MKLTHRVVRRISAENPSLGITDVNAVYSEIIAACGKVEEAGLAVRKTVNPKADLKAVAGIVGVKAGFALQAALLAHGFLSDGKKNPCFNISTGKAKK